MSSVRINPDTGFPENLSANDLVRMRSRGFFVTPSEIQAQERKEYYNRQGIGRPDAAPNMPNQPKPPQVLPISQPRDPEQVNPIESPVSLPPEAKAIADLARKEAENTSNQSEIGFALNQAAALSSQLQITPEQALQLVSQNMNMGIGTAEPFGMEMYNNFPSPQPMQLAQQPNIYSGYNVQPQIMMQQQPQFGGYNNYQQSGNGYGGYGGIPNMYEPQDMGMQNQMTQGFM
tara:strand:+ start:403 stop:1098 length:696 start_codon:yes stop_codon:yes gene_type:complete